MAYASDSADSPAHRDKEIEITPEMIEAGRLALLSFDKDYESFDDGARRIFLSMMSSDAMSKRREPLRR
jgi:hypothetical protein